MNVSKPLGPAVSEMSEVEVEADVGELARGHAVIRQGENGDGEVSVIATEFSRLLQRVSGNSQIYNREGALAAVRRCSLAFFGLAAIHFILAGLLVSLGSVSIFFIFEGLGTYIVVAELAAMLHIFYSRIAASLLIVFYVVITVSTLLLPASQGHYAAIAMALLGLGLAIDAAYATFKLHGQFAADDKLKREGTPKAYDVEKWRVLLVYDKDIAAVAEKLTPLGEKWGDQFARDFLALNDKRYLLDVVRKVIADARQSVRSR